MSDMSTTTTQDPSSSKQRKGVFRRYRITLLFLAAVIAFVGFILIRAHLQTQALREQMLVQQTEIQQQANKQMAELTDELLSFAVKGYDWAIRAELIRGNEENAQQYIAQMVQDEKISQVMFIDEQQVIQMASDKKQENQPFDVSLFPENPLQYEDIVILEQTDGSLLLFSPIMGLERRLGTLMIRYHPQPFAYETRAVRKPGSPDADADAEN